MKQLILQIEEKLRLGEHAWVRKQLSLLKPSQIERVHAVQLAVFAGRVHYPQFSLRLLNPFVRPENKFQSPATERETAEYAVALHQIGAHHEAQKLLLELSPLHFPELHRYLAFSHIYQWEYAKAIPCLEAYLASVELTSYQRATTLLNLTAAHLYVSDLDAASACLDELSTALATTNFEVLKGNSLELSAQLAFYRRDFRAGFSALELARTKFKDSSNLYSFFLEKWYAIGTLLEKGANSETLAEVAKCRSKALDVTHFESARECDFFQAVVSGDEKLLTHVYLGTPHQSYRERLGRLTRGWNCRATYDWLIFDGKPATKILDIKLGRELDSEIDFGGKKKIVEVVSALSQDFYQPVTLGALFHRLFKDLHYDPNTSTNRIHQLLRRTRHWFEENGVPLTTEMSGSRYLLKATAPYAIRVHASKLELDSRYQIPLVRLHVHFGNREFTIKEVMDQFGMPKSTANRIVKYGISNSLISNRASQGMTYYAFTASSASLRDSA